MLSSIYTHLLPYSPTFLSVYYFLHQPNRMLQSSVRPELYAERMVNFILKHTDYSEIMTERAERAAAAAASTAGAAGGGSVSDASVSGSGATSGGGARASVSGDGKATAATAAAKANRKNIL